RFSPNSRPIQSEPGRRADVGNVMNKDSNGTFGIIIGGVVAVIAAIFILSGGELGGKQTVKGDQDLPPVATTDKSRHLHGCGLNWPAACSTMLASENSVSSSKGRPISCNPSGSSCASRPAGTAIPGSPAMFTVTVNTSFRYISTGSAPFSPRPKAADGVAGVSMACTPALKQSSKSFLISVRTLCARK